MVAKLAFSDILLFGKWFNSINYEWINATFNTQLLIMSFTLLYRNRITKMAIEIVKMVISITWIKKKKSNSWLIIVHAINVAMLFGVLLNSARILYRLLNCLAWLIFHQISWQVIWTMEKSGCSQKLWIWYPWDQHRRSLRQYPWSFVFLNFYQCQRKTTYPSLINTTLIHDFSDEVEAKAVINRDLVSPQKWSTIMVTAVQ